MKCRFGPVPKSNQYLFFSGAARRGAEAFAPPRTPPSHLRRLPRPMSLRLSGSRRRQAGVAGCRPAYLFDDLINMNPSTCPRVPRTEKSTLLGPMGVSVMELHNVPVHIVPSAIGRRPPRRSGHGQPSRSAPFRFASCPGWSLQMLSTNFQPGPLDGGRAVAPPLPDADAPVTEILQRGFEMLPNTCPVDCTHHPAMSVPCGKVDGLPVGMMLIGRHYDEHSICRAASAFESSADWSTISS